MCIAKSIEAYCSCQVIGKTNAKREYYRYGYFETDLKESYAREAPGK